jgi:hypothetical protein
MDSLIVIGHRLSIGRESMNNLTVLLISTILMDLGAMPVWII